MIELEMRGLGLFGGALLSTGALAQLQQPRSACMENAIAVPCTAVSHAERATSAEQNRRCTICRDDLRLSSFLPFSGLKQKVTVPPDGMATQAIAPAGGLAARAKSQVFPYRSVSSNWAEVQELKVKDLFHGKNISDGRHARHGDMIFVPEKRAQAPRGERLLRWWQRA